MDKLFMFGVSVGPDYFIGREYETERLSANFKYGINTILISPRRIGKTSLVKRVAKLVDNSEIKIVHLDIFSCRSEYDFYNMFAAAVLSQTASRLEEWKQNAQDFLSRLTPKMSFSPEPMQEYSISLGITPKTHTPEEILNLPQRIAEKKGYHIIMCIDEFQQVGDFPESLTVQKRMRTAWQHQENVSYCLFGSKKNMMTALFQQRSKPFYKFGQTMELGVIPTETWIPYLRDRFAMVGKVLPEDIAIKICDKVQNYSSYVQELAYDTFLRTKTEPASEMTLDMAFEDLLDENTSMFIEKTERLTSYQLNFLHAISDGIHEDFGKSSVREEYNLGSSSNIPRVKTALLERELIEKKENGIFIADPVMEAWLKRRFCWA